MSKYKIDQWALPKIKQFRTYIDIGAHDGDTSIPYIDMFKRIYAFEPNPQTNIKIPDTIKTYPFALGEKEMETVLIIPDNGFDNNEHGSTVRHKSGIRQYSVTQKTLDSFEFKEVDFGILKNESVESEQVQPEFSPNPDFTTETSLESWVGQERTISRKVQEARLKGYEGEACNTCQQFTMVRNGSCLKCASCGAVSYTHLTLPTNREV